jgi:nicotinate dehydrogenase subunit A
MPIELHVNGALHVLDVAPDTPLLFVLRNDLGLTAAKLGCGLEQCGACAVLVDGEDVTSCATSVDAFAGKRIVTPEGIGSAEAPHRVQQAFMDEQAAQCGYCIPGMVVAGVALLDHSPAPSDAEIREALAGHLCRCGTHTRIVKAIERAAAR